MAFVGVATITSLGKSIVRITGLSLAGSTSGTIGFAGDVGADEQLPATFPSDAELAGAIDGLTLSDVIRAWYINDGIGGGGGESRHVHVSKALGPPFRITFENDQGVATASLEIWIECLHTLIR